MCHAARPTSRTHPRPEYSPSTALKVIYDANFVQANIFANAPARRFGNFAECFAPSGMSECARVGDLIRRRICFNGAAKFSHLEAPAMKFRWK